MTERFPALSLEEMTPAQRAVAEEISAGPRGGVRGPFRVLLHHPPLARRLQQLGEYLRYETRLPNDLLELAILVTARRWTCQYEWFAHERFARDAGLGAPVIEAIASGRRPAGMTPDEAAVHDFAATVQQTGHAGDAPYDQVVARFGREGALDLLAICGYYAALAMILNTSGLPLPDGTAPPLQPLHSSPGGTP